MISVQVLKEILANCIRKARMTWEEAGQFLSDLRELVGVRDLR
jgi:predicted nucleic acid-binding protein